MRIFNSIRPGKQVLKTLNLFDTRNYVNPAIALFSLIFLIFLPIFSFSSQASGKLKPDVIKRIEKGEIVTTTHVTDRCFGVNTLALIDGDIETVWKVINDFDHFKDFMPHTIKSKAVKREGNTVYYNGVVKIMLLPVNYVLKHTLEDTPDRKVDTWEQVEKPRIYDDDSVIHLTITDGKWILGKYDGKTLSDYTACVNISDKVPEAIRKKAIDILLNFSVLEVIEATRRQTKKLLLKK